MIRKHPYQSLFLCSALVIGLVFWHQANWWVYVEDDPEPILKFELPWWIQAPVSAVVGAVGGGGIVLLVRGIVRRTRKWPLKSRHGVSLSKIFVFV